MYQERTIKHARQDKADHDVKLAATKAEMGRLLDVPREKRSGTQAAKLDELKGTLQALEKEAIDVAREVSHFEAINADLIKSVGARTSTDAPRPKGRRYAEMFPGV